MSVKKLNLEMLTREENLISAQEEKAKALFLKARNRKQALARRRARVMMEHLDKVNIDGSNIPFLVGAAVYITQQGAEKITEIEALGNAVMENPQDYKIEKAFEGEEEAVDD